MMNVVLCGLTKSGKTTCGEYLAQSSGMGLIDTDKLILSDFTPHWSEHALRDLYKRMGEQAFRQTEQAVIMSLEDVNHTVIATGAGCVISDMNVDKLASFGPLVYLYWPKSLYMKHLTAFPFPVAASNEDSEQAIDEYYAARHQRCLSVCEHTVYMPGYSTKDVCDHVHRIMQEENKSD